jgi:mannose-6-phosphate isomerase-like protein (cupin superfamily)
MTNEIGKTYTRPWGTYQTLALSDGYQVKLIEVNPGGRLSLQKHAKRSEHWMVVEGAPTITVDETVNIHQVNDHMFIPIGVLHRIENLTDIPVKIVEVQVGEYLGEDDIIRIDDVYGRG